MSQVEISEKNFNLCLKICLRKAATEVPVQFCPDFCSDFFSQNKGSVLLKLANTALIR